MPTGAEAPQTQGRANSHTAKMDPRAHAHTRTGTPACIDTGPEAHLAHLAHIHVGARVKRCTPCGGEVLHFMF